MVLDKEEFNRLFLEKYFKQILRNEKEFQAELDTICELLSKLHVQEFGEKSPDEILSEYQSVENWIRKKIPTIRIS